MMAGSNGIYFSEPGREDCSRKHFKLGDPEAGKMCFFSF